MALEGIYCWTGALFIVTGRVGCLFRALIVGRGPSFQLNEIRPSFRMMQIPNLI